MHASRFFGFTILLLGLYLAFFMHSKIWYSFFVIGGFLFLESLNSKEGFSVLNDKKKFLFVFFIFAILGILIEIVGNLWLNLWDFPNLNKLDYLIHVIIITYPLVSFFGLELFVLINRITASRTSLLIIAPITAFIFGFLNEYPNLFAYEWRYNKMPFGELFGIPILMYFSWLLILFTLLFKKLFVLNKS